MVRYRLIILLFLLCGLGWLSKITQVLSSLGIDFLFLIFIVICPLLATALCAYNRSAIQRRQSQDVHDKRILQQLRINTALLVVGFMLSVIGLGYVILR